MLELVGLEGLVEAQEVDHSEGHQGDLHLGLDPSEDLLFLQLMESTKLNVSESDNSFPYFIFHRLSLSHIISLSLKRPELNVFHLVLFSSVS